MKEAGGSLSKSIFWKPLGVSRSLTLHFGARQAVLTAAGLFSKLQGVPATLPRQELPSSSLGAAPSHPTSAYPRISFSSLSFWDSFPALSNPRVTRKQAEFLYFYLSARTTVVLITLLA